MCIFSGEKPQYNIYKYKYENNKLLVSEVTEKTELEEITKTFVKEGVDEFGIYRPRTVFATL
jgi:hypothetical protein